MEFDTLTPRFRRRFHVHRNAIDCRFPENGNDFTGGIPH